MKKKKFLILLLVMSFAITGYGFEKGTMSIGGGISIANSKSGDYSSYNRFSLQPALSYFVNDHLCLDLSPGFSVSWGKDRDTYHSYSLGLGGRYFFKLFYGGVRYYHSWAGRSGYKSNAGYIDFKLGKMVPITKNIYLDFSLIYTMGIGDIHFTEDFSNDNEYRSFSAGVGFTYFFKK